MLNNAPEYQLSEPQKFYVRKKHIKTKIAEPLIQKLKSVSQDGIGSLL
mgnify:CR=1 FL=1